ncbi:MAG: PKD domain-containing protein, partial [Bacteroidetes bacterium]|nr:PKD domain-containing protein [Bacteroidota bacterium]
PTGALSAAFNASTTQGEAPLTVNFFDQSGDGTSSVTCSKTGYITYINNQVVIGQGQSFTLNISLSQTLGEGALRFVINWGASPADLDSHLNTPVIEGQAWHIYYSYQGSATSAPFAALDHDVTSGYGPETMTIYQMFPGTYQYYIYNYSGSPEITTSNAVIQIYNQTGLIQTMQIPTTGTGRYWYVCDVNGSNGQLTYKNIIQQAPPGNLKFNMPEKKTEETRNITSWMWNFGDGTTSTVQNPTKVYNSPGTYTVSLTVGNGITTATETKIGYITVTGAGSGTGTLTGMVTDALNGNPVEGALVSVAGLSATTNASGNYTIVNVPIGVLVSNFIANTTQGLAPLTVNFTDQSAENANIVTCSKQGYLTYSNSQVVIPQDGSLTLNISLSSQLTAGEMRFVLNWGLNPDDLDSHLNTPAINGQSYHIYYNNQGSVGSPPYAALDHDVTTSYGPETMTIYQMFPGTYQYYIYNYSGSPEIITSQAVVQIYNQSGLLNTLQVPTAGAGLYWYICDIDGATGHITIRNVIQESAPGNLKFDMPAKIPAGNKNVTSWLWNFGDGGTSTQQNPSHVYNAVGNYTVSLTVGDGVTQATETKIAYIQVSAIGLDEFDLFDLIKLYPQPAENELTIESPFRIERMRILDLSGREIVGLQRVDNTLMRISTSDFGKGVYLLYLETVNGTAVKKFTVK